MKKQTASKVFFAIVVMSLILITMLIAWLQAYVIGPLLNKPRVYPYNCTRLINCTAEGIIFPRVNCQCIYYGSECEDNSTEWCKKIN